MNNKKKHHRNIRVYIATAILGGSMLAGCSSAGTSTPAANTTSATATAVNVGNVVAPTLALPTVTPIATAPAKPAAPTAPPTVGATKAAPTPPPLKPTTTALPELSIVGVKTTDKNEKQFYEIITNIPKLQGGKQAASVAAFNAYVRGILSKDVAKYKSDFINNGKPTGFEGSNYLETSYDILLISPSFISLRLNYAYYYAGAAHPNSNSLALNYDLDKRTVVPLSSQFKPGTTYLKTISDYANKELEAKLSDAFFKEGATAKPENFKIWGIDDKGLVLHFDAYQVGPYAVGPQEVVIPKAALSSLLNPAGQLAKLVK